MDRRSFLFQSIAATAQTLASARHSLAGMTSWPDGPAKHRFPNIVLKTHENRQVRFYDDLVKGKHIVLNFMYASCPDSCPLQTANLALVQKILGPRVGQDIFMYSVTLDPTHDTPDVLKEYAARFGIQPGWEFLTGAAEDIELLRRKVGFVNRDPVLDRDKSQHIGMVLYGNESLDRWSACPALSTADNIAKYVLWMEARSNKPAVGAVERGAAARPV
jgi:protein SCO1/2